LSCAIQLGKAGFSVILFEKETYPFHKVCGEYVSLESWEFIRQLGLALEDMKLPIIDTLFLTAPDGSSFTARLPLGGFGISRYLLDSRLAIIAKQNGVFVIENTKVDEVIFNKQFHVKFTSRKTDQRSLTAKVCCAAFGKRSNLDVKWERRFLKYQDKRLDNYVAVKYHVHAKWKENIIGLHNFKGGYCGISKIEEDKYCLCYMTKAANLNQCNNDIKEVEKKILFKNKHLKKIFSEAKTLDGFPITISQINFRKKCQVEDHVLMLGDAAGMITPLCGNGMSIALHTSKISFQLICQFLRGEIDRSRMEEEYKRQWRHHFAQRLRAGRTLQQFFGSTVLGNFFVGVFKAAPFLSKAVIRMTHGKPF
jgi:menaquinone-9 beta-reductase